MSLFDHAEPEEDSPPQPARRVGLVASIAVALLVAIGAGAYLALQRSAR